MNNHQITILGAGNMGASLLEGLLTNGTPANHIWISDPDIQKLNTLKEKFQINITTDNQTAIQTADVIILAVKPQIIKDVAKSLQKTKALIISVAAGINIHHLEEWTGKQTAIIRCMPNTPALIQAGITALYANPNVTPAQKDLAESILRAVGTVVWLEQEKLMDAVTALSGSGPAYFFLIIEILQQVGVELGLNPELAKLLTIETALGAARMVAETKQPAAELRRRVTSPGGTTAAAISVLEKGNLQMLFTEALKAAKMRSEELGS